MKMTTPIPDAIVTPQSVDTSLGKLNLFDGFPDDATSEKIYDNLDFMRDVAASLNAMSGASVEALRIGVASQGADNNQTILISEDLMDSRSDSSVDVWFGPTEPEDHEANWVQTAPGKGWNVVLRLYAPLEPWFDKSWKPGEIEVVQ